MSKKYLEVVTTHEVGGEALKTLLWNMMCRGGSEHGGDLMDARVLIYDESGGVKSRVTANNLDRSIIDENWCLEFSHPEHGRGRIGWASLSWAIRNLTPGCGKTIARGGHLQARFLHAILMKAAFKVTTMGLPPEVIGGMVEE